MILSPSRIPAGAEFLGGQMKVKPFASVIRSFFGGHFALGAAAAGKVQSAVWFLLAAVLWAAPAQAESGSWSKVKTLAPGFAGTMLLLTDGTVMVQEYSNAWMRLTPDSSGSYINGTWTTLASMRTPRLYMASQVLPSGKVWVAGGEYSGTALPGNWGAGGEIYNPLSNTWSKAATFPNQSNCPYFYTFGGAITAGSPVMTGILSTAGFQPGWYIYGNGIPNGATIASVDPGGTQIHLSTAATETASQGIRFELEAGSSGNLTASSNVITGVTSTTGFGVGWYIYGTGIPPGATITKVNSAHEITISAPATETAASDFIYFLVNVKRNTCMGDDSSIMLTSEKILVADPFSRATYFYEPATNTYSLAAQKVYDANDEEGWVKLGNGSILTYDIYKSLDANEGYAELYNPAANKWSSISPGDGTAHGTLPLLTLGDSDEIGPVLRLLDGRIFQVGANGLTALYTPSTNTWKAGPKIDGTINRHPFLYVADDAPAALLPTGHVFFAADAGLGVSSTGTTESGSAVISDIPSAAVDVLQVGWSVSGNGIPGGAQIKSVNASAHEITLTGAATGTSTSETIEFGGPYSAPSELFDYNPVAGTISPVSPAFPDTNLPFVSSYLFRMLMLPNGELLVDDSSEQLWVYTPSGGAASTYLPAVDSVEHVSGSEYLLTGTQLTGQSAGASYGDDAQMDENYPIVRLVSSADKVYYLRTTNWSSTDVSTGSLKETVNFTVGSSVPAGKYSLIVSAAGIQSKAFSFTVP